MKKDRHKKILDLIKENAISTQEELASALNQAGYNVTQATVSRDIRELNLTKTTADGILCKFKYLIQCRNSFPCIFGTMIYSCI